MQQVIESSQSSSTFSIPTLTALGRLLIFTLKFSAGNPWTLPSVFIGSSIVVPRPLAEKMLSVQKMFGSHYACSVPPRISEYFLAFPLCRYPIDHAVLAIICSWEEFEHPFLSHSNNKLSLGMGPGNIPWLLSMHTRFIIIWKQNSKKTSFSVQLL